MINGIVPRICCNETGPSAPKMHLLRIANFHKSLSVIPTGGFLSSQGFSFGNYKFSNILLQALSFGCEIALRPTAFILHRIAMGYLNKHQPSQSEYNKYLVSMLTKNISNTLEILEIIKNLRKEKNTQEQEHTNTLLRQAMYNYFFNSPKPNLTIIVELLKYINQGFTNIWLDAQICNDQIKINISKNNRIEKIFTFIEMIREPNKHIKHGLLDFIVSCPDRISEELIKLIITKYLELGDIDINVLNRLLKCANDNTRRDTYQQAADIMRTTDALTTSAMINLIYQRGNTIAWQQKKFLIFKEYAKSELEELKKRYLPVQNILNAHLPNDVNQIIMQYDADTQRMLTYAIQMYDKYLCFSFDEKRFKDDYNLFLYKLAEFYVDYENCHPGYQDFDKALELYEYLPNEPVSKYGRIRNALYDAMKKTNLTKLRAAHSRVLKPSGDSPIKRTLQELLQELKHQIENSNDLFLRDKTEASLEEVTAILRKIDASNAD